MPVRNIEQKVRSDLGQSQVYVDERTAWVRVQREQAELRLAAMRAELAPVGLLLIGLGAAASAVRQNVMSVAPTVAQRCVGKSAEEINQIIAAAHSHALEQFSEDRIAGLIYEACESFEGGSAAPAESNDQSVGRRREGAQSGVERKARKVGHRKR